MPDVVVVVGGTVVVVVAGRVVLVLDVDDDVVVGEGVVDVVVPLPGGAGGAVVEEPVVVGVVVGGGRPLSAPAGMANHIAAAVTSMTTATRHRSRTVRRCRNESSDLRRSATYRKSNATLMAPLAP